MEKKYTEDEVRSILKNKKKIKRFHTMATEAHHLLGNISSNEPDLAIIDSETENFWVGAWVYGFGFCDVLFPKNTTCDLTKEQFKRYNGSGYAINGAYKSKIEIIKQ